MTINPNDTFIRNNIEKVRKIISDTEVLPWFMATPKLKQLIANGDPRTVGIAEFYKKTLLEGNGLALDNNTLIKYLDGTIDDRNKFLLDNSEIRVSFSSGTEDGSTLFNRKLFGDILKGKEIGDKNG